MGHPLCGGLNMFADEGGGGFGDIGFVAAAFEPVDFGFAAEPGELALGVVAMALLGLGDGFVAGEFIAQDGDGLGVAEGLQGTAVVAVAFDELRGFFDQAVLKHGGGAEVDAFVELRAGRREADAEDAVAGERVAAVLMGFGDGAAGEQRDFERADDLGEIVGVHLGGAGGVELCEQAMQCASPVACFFRAEAIAERFGACGAGEEAVDERAEIEARASRDDGEIAATGDAGEGFACVAAVVSGGVGFVGIAYVDEVMRGEFAFGARGLGGADLHLAKDGD